VAENSGIQWTHHTWNPWRGCVEVSEGCRSCYAREFAKRNPAVLGAWGKDEPRPLASEGYMNKPFTWARKARQAKERHRVFLGSMMDFWEDNDQLVEVRRRVADIVLQLPGLDWLVLTKRPEVMRQYSRGHAKLFGPSQPFRFVSMAHVWSGVTVENQRRADERIPLLLEATDGCPRRWLSVEPLLEPIDLEPWLKGGQIQWVIVGGESNQGGMQARPFDLEWCESVVEQCRRHAVPVFVKQMGSRPVAAGLGLRLKDRHGGQMEEWPEWMRVRQFPEAMRRFS
jgi:protein gp37